VVVAGSCIVVTRQITAVTERVARGSDESSTTISLSLLSTYSRGFNPVGDIMQFANSFRGDHRSTGFSGRQHV